MEAAARRLHAERGLSTDAARLLFEARAFPPLASLLLDLLSADLLASPSANPARALLAAPADPNVEARLAQLSRDAAAFMSVAQRRRRRGRLARGRRPRAHARRRVAARRRRAVRAALGPGGEAALTTTLEQLAGYGCSRAPVEVDARVGDFRLAPPPLQRLAPPLVLTAMEATHAKFVALRRARGGGGGGGSALGAATELRSLRERGEALVAFGGASVCALRTVGQGGRRCRRQRVSSSPRGWRIWRDAAWLTRCHVASRRGDRAGAVVDGSKQPRVRACRHPPKAR